MSFKSLSFSLEDFLNVDLLAEINTHMISQQSSSYARDGSNDDSLYFQGDDENTKDRELMSAQVPGVVTRMWFTGNPQARLRFYFDGESSPRINMTIAELTAGNNAPFLYPLVGSNIVSSGGYYCYLPILFQKSLLILGDGVQYYNINFNTFDTSANLISFTGKEEVAELAEAWKNSGSDPKSFTDNELFSKTVDLAKSGKADLTLYDGSAGLASLKLHMPDIGKHLLYDKEDHCGRAYKGYSKWTMGINPENHGVVLRKMFDYGISDQKVKIYVDDAFVGEWCAPGGNNAIRWHEIDFQIPSGFTENKSSVTIRSEFLSAENDVNEFRYQAYSLINGHPVLTDTLNIFDGESEEAHHYTVTDQTWEGSATYMGAISDPEAKEPAEKTKEILNGVSLRIYFDEEAEPSVDAPLGAFFAVGSYGYGMDTTGLLVGYGPDDILYCYYPMPFKSTARMELVNKTEYELRDINIAWAVNSKLKRTSTNGYFKTQYHDVIAESGKYMTALEETSGHGRLVGIMQSALGDIGRRYLEGDEVFYVDGSREHSGHGTGTEDIYNGAWYFERGIFSLPLHGYTALAMDVDSGTSASAMYRTYLGDSIVFRKGMLYVLEHGTMNDEPDSKHQILACYYYSENNKLSFQDSLNVSDSADAKKHNYQSDGTAFETEGNFQAYYSQVHETVQGIATQGTGSMAFNIAPDNNGVLIKRLFCHDLRESALVYVDNQPVGIWTTNFTGGTKDTYSALGEDFFLIPAWLTKGKGQITVAFENKGGDTPWREAQYTVYCYT